MNVTSAPEYFDPEELLSVEETAKILGVSIHSLSAWRWEKRGPAYYKVGKYVRYRRVDLAAFVASTRHAHA